jgi:hypothetical protein
MVNITWKYVKALKSPTSIDDFEKKEKIHFPHDLKQCFIERNGGRPFPNAFDTDASEGRVFKTLFSFNDSDSENIFTFFPILRAETPQLIPFASDPFGNFICLNGSAIVLYLHETGKIEHIADSFSAFLEKLH